MLKNAQKNMQIFYALKMKIEMFLLRPSIIIILKWKILQNKNAYFSVSMLKNAQKNMRVIMV